MKLRTIILGFGIIALTGAGCSSGAGSTIGGAGDKMYDSCTLLTKADAEALLGKPVKDASTTGSLSAGSRTVSNCSYSTVDLSNRASVGLLVRHAASALEAATVQSDAIKASKNLSGADPEDISGLGDKAYWAGGSLNQLNIFVGNSWLIISARGPAGSDVKKTAEDAAHLILPRM